MGKKKAKRYWQEYFLSFHLGFCNGPVDALTAVFMREKEAWKGEEPITANTTVALDNPMLFGGDEREGGIQGQMHVMLGDGDQLSPPALATRLGLTPETMPGFRGIASLVFTGNGAGEGMLVSANYPSVPTVWARFRRSSKGLAADGGVIVNSLGMHDSNPAHMLHELFTNGDWGMGAHPDALDLESFIYAAGVLATEGFGLSMMWTRQGTVESFAQEILDHIQGMFFFNPKTGKGTLKLLRADYDPNALPTIGPEDCVLKTFRRKLWGETINEVVIEWTNPTTEESETLTYQDLANIAMQGEVVSQSSNYYGIRSPELAARVGARDIVSSAVPLASATITLNRRHWDLLPGDVFKFSYPKHGIDSVIMRVMEMDYGSPDKAEMKVNLLEDIFGLPMAKFVLPPSTEWEDPEQDPNGPEYAIPPETIFIALPYPLVVQTVGEAPVTDDRFPEILVAPLVTPLASQKDMMSYVLNEYEPLPDSSFAWINSGEKSLTGAANLLGPFPPRKEVESVVKLDLESFRGRTWPQQGGLGLIRGAALGDHQWNDDGRTDSLTELVMFLEDLGEGRWRIARGMLDTVPRRWMSGRIWFIDDNFNSVDLTPEVADTELTYKIQPRTSAGLRDLALIEALETDHPPRPYLPFRPANTRIDGVLFSERTVPEDDPPEPLDFTKNYAPRAWIHQAAWAIRHRKMEDSVYRRWDEGSVVGEAAQTTELRFDAVNAGLFAVSGISDHAFAIDVMKTGRSPAFLTTFIGERDGLKSLQANSLAVKLYDKGYGSDWGYFWGGWPEEWEIGDDITPANPQEQ